MGADIGCLRGQQVTDQGIRLLAADRVTLFYGIPAGGELQKIVAYVLD